LAGDDGPDMPHAVLEFSDNLPPIDTGSFFARLHEALAGVGYGLDDLKSRAYRCDSYRVGSGAARRGFAHLTLVVLDRRDVAVQRAAGEAASALLAETFARAGQELDCDLTVEVREARSGTYFKTRLSPSP